jgi:hypothetical protein
LHWQEVLELGWSSWVWSMAVFQEQLYKAQNKAAEMSVRSVNSNVCKDSYNELKWLFYFWSVCYYWCMAVAMWKATKCMLLIYLVIMRLKY